MTTQPSQDDYEEVLLSSRYGDLEDIQLFVQKFGPEPLIEARDGNGNNVLHMACGNGHLDVLEYLLPIVPPTLLGAPNGAGSTPLHWAALNAHLAVAQRLVNFAPAEGATTGVRLIDVKNKAGRTPLGEAENAGWEEGARWFVQVMDIDGDGDGDGGAKAEDGEAGGGAGEREIEVEIEDAEGRVARMKIGGPGAEAAEAAPTADGTGVAP